MIQLAPATSLSLHELTALLNCAFRDYVIPIQLAPDDLAAMVQRDDIVLADSYVALRQQNPVGAALVAVRWQSNVPLTRLATMGVALEGRRSGIGGAMLDRVSADARARGSRAVVLEAFVHNAPAVRLYESRGFAARRRLLGCSLAAAPLRARDPGDVSLVAAGSDAMLAAYDLCTTGEDAAALPPWQLDRPALARFGPPTGLYIVQVGGVSEAVGYLVLGQSRPTAHLVHLGVAPRWRRRGVATRALAAAARLYRDLDTFYVPQLLPEASSLAPFLRALGAVEERYPQIEMWLDLPAP